VKVFERNRQEFVKGNRYEGIFDIIKQRTTENQLFLGKAALENVDFKDYTFSVANSNSNPSRLFEIRI
jgi:hypothetical protein